MPALQKLVAYTLPILAFVIFLVINSALVKIDHLLWLSWAEYWIYPLQTILCGGLLIWFRREYAFHSLQQIGFAVVVGVIAFVFWISPQLFFGFAPRTLGFNPDLFANQSPLYWLEITLRFARLVAVVPFVEEIFWRGFLLRFFIDENFERVPFGTFSWLSFWIVTLGFALSHSRADWPAALLTGVLFNTVAYRTKSLASCILTHAVTNLLLGLWIMKTRQWGFW